MSIDRKAAPISFLAALALAGCSAGPTETAPSPVGVESPRDAGSPPETKPVEGPDGATTDPLRDAASDAAPRPNHVSVKVLHARRPVAEVSVVFHDAAGEILEVVETDITGVARSTSPAPAMASALVGNAGNRHIVTWTGLVMGDELVTEDFSALRDERRYQTSVGKYAISVARIPGSFDYTTFVGQCLGFGNGTVPIVLDVRTQCEGTTNAIVARCTDPADNTKRLYSWKKNLQPPPAAGITPVTMAPFTAGETVRVDLVGKAAGQSAIASVTDFAGSQLQFGPIGLFYTANTTSALDMPAGFADARQVNVLATGPANDGTYRSIIARGAPRTTNTVDLAALPPRITSGTVSTADLARFELAWSSESAWPTADGTIARVRYADPKVDEHYAWTFVTPPSTQRVRAPKMPSIAAAWLPDSKRSLFNTPHVWTMDFDSMSSYRQFVVTGAPLLPLDDQSTGERDIWLPANDMLRVSSYHAPTSGLYP